MKVLEKVSLFLLGLGAGGRLAVENLWPYNYFLIIFGIGFAGLLVCGGINWNQYLKKKKG